MTHTNELPKNDWPRTLRTFGVASSAAESREVTWLSTQVGTTSRPLAVDDDLGVGEIGMASSGVSPSAR